MRRASSTAFQLLAPSTRHQQRRTICSHCLASTSCFQASSSRTQLDRPCFAARNATTLGSSLPSQRRGYAQLQPQKWTDEQEASLLQDPRQNNDPESILIEEKPAKAQNPSQAFESLGLSSGLSRQLNQTYPFIQTPSASQRKLIPAVLAPNDVILRAHTGSGKSFGLLLALMAKPRITFKNEDSSQSASTGIASLILVPTNELAEQYISWAKRLLPPSIASSTDAVIQAVMRGHPSRSPEEQIKLLTRKPPHILVATPRRALEILNEPGGATLLGLPTLRSLVLDEADSVLDLPGKFPSAKMVWNNIAHPPPGLKLVNEIMKMRATHSGGELIASAGMEPANGKKFDERRPPENIRRTQHRSNERRNNFNSDEGGLYKDLAVPKKLRRFEQPLQVIACSASANAVLRHFLGAKTGWLRVGVRRQENRDVLSFGRQSRDEEGDVTGRWIDLTGLSGATSVESHAELVERKKLSQRVMPTELDHACIIVDEGLPQDLLSGQNENVRYLPPMRNLSAKRLSRSLRPEHDEGHYSKKKQDQMVVSSIAIDRSEIDRHLLEALASVFALEGTTRGIAFIPPQWSLKSTMAELSASGVPIVPLEDLLHSEEQPDSAEPKLALLQATSARGLDLPALSHVFILGLEAVGDTVRYTHLAGRAARLGPHSGSTEQRLRGRVITLVRGLKTEDVLKNEGLVRKQRQQQQQSDVADDLGSTTRRSSSDVKKLYISSGEKRISSIYHRLDVKPRRVQLKGLSSVLEEEEVELEEQEAEAEEDHSEQ